jgi:hypothetical protein
METQDIHRRRNTSMADAKIELEWHRDSAGYELLPAEPGRPDLSLVQSVGRPARIVPRGGQSIAYKPLELDELYARFAAVHTPEDVLEFIRRFGPLTRFGSDRGEIVSDVLDHAAAFRSFLSYDEEHKRELALWAGADGKRVGQLDLVLGQDPASGALRLQLRPPSLLAGLWLQLGQKLSGNRPFRECPYCRTWFETGPGTGRRLDATFCTDDHRVLFNSRKRSKGRTAHA